MCSCTFVAKEKSCEEITKDVRKEKGPVSLRHSLRCVEKVVDDVCKHVAEIIQEVDADLCRVRENVLEMCYAQVFLESVSTVGAHLIYVREGIVKRGECIISFVFCPLFSSQDNILSRRTGIQGAKVTG